MPAESQFKEGYVRAVTVNGKPEYLVRGMWVEMIQDGRASPTTWDPNVALSVMYQEQTDRWINIVALTNPERKGFTEQHLLEIAGSFEAC